LHLSVSGQIAVSHPLGVETMNWPPDVDTTALVLLIFVALVAGMSRGFSGFGAALIFVPLAGVLVGPKLGAPILVIIDGIFASYLIPSAWKLGDRRDIALMFSGAIIGVPVGTVILTLFAPLTLRWLIAGMALAMLILLISGWRYHGRPHALATIVVGAISGLFSGIAQIGGPPVVSYWLGTETAYAKLRANIILYFAASTVLSLTTYVWGGLMTAQVLKLALFTGPAYGLGTLAGARMFGLASPAVFRTSSLGLIALAVLFSLPVFGR
jgi:uncharacterized protein